MAKYSDITITCTQCGKEFTFTEDEQEFYKLKGFTTPHRCKPCRSNIRQQSTLACSHCGNKISAKDNITCISCLTAVQLDSDLKVKQIQMVLDETNVKLASLESERSGLLADADERLITSQAESKRLLEESNARAAAIEVEREQISQLLKQKEQMIVELEWRLNQTNQELEKASKYRATLDDLQPSLTSLNEKLGSLDRAQTNLIQALLQIADKLDEKHKNGFIEMIRDFVRLDSSRTVGQ